MAGLKQHSFKNSQHKCVQIQNFFWSVFSCIRTKYGEILCISPYSVRMRENTDQKKFRIWTLFTQCKVYWQRSLYLPFLDIALVGIKNCLIKKRGRIINYMCPSPKVLPSIIKKKQTSSTSDRNMGSYYVSYRIFP